MAHRDILEKLLFVGSSAQICSTLELTTDMKYQAFINVMPHRELLDPQGKTVARNIDHVGITGVETVRIGKHIEMVFDASSEAEAREKVDTACKKLLANVIMETYEFTIEEVVLETEQ